MTSITTSSGISGGANLSLEQAVKAEAHRLGFALAGITTPDPPPHFPVFESWLDAGRHGEMGYLAAATARQTRADPGLILPGCRSILVLGMRYPPDYPRDGGGHVEDTQVEPSLKGRVASYAWGTDYHEILPERMQALVKSIESLVGRAVSNRWYTDTGPILERDLAQRAGLGWIGKNTCLIHPRQGSNFLLAEILLDLELAVDAPFHADRCGSCTRCLEACPTACILPDRTLDARRCLSYLTIELKGAIPQELRSLLGNWVFGCDLCQQVCPWNQRFASADLRIEPAFMPRPELPEPDLLRELTLTREAFNQKFRGSPVKRTRRTGYLRNVAVALGNSGNLGAIPTLAQALEHDPEPLVRGHAAWALGRLQAPVARSALENARLRESDLLVQDEIRTALGEPRQEGNPRDDIMH